MASCKLGVFASLALAASAVLIPPTISTEDIGDDNALETLAIDPLKRSVTLECRGCAFATQENDALKWKSEVGSAYVSTSITSPQPYRDMTGKDHGSPELHLNP